MHADYVKLVEERLENFLQCEGFTAQGFTLVLHRAIKSGSLRGSDFLNYLLALVDFDIFMSMVDDVRNNSFSAE
jgi:hypothetical protein